MPHITFPNPLLSAAQAAAAAALVQPRPSVLDYVETGLLPPVSGGLTQTYPSGSAWVNNARVLYLGASVTFTANSDNYVDIQDNGTLRITAVAVAAASPAIPVNCLRVGFCTTNASAVISRTITAFDTLGNWMYNTTPFAGCRVTRTTATGYAGAAIVLPFPEADAFDNASMHDPATNNSRVTFPSSGAYMVSCSVIWFGAVTPGTAFSLQPRLDGSINDPSFPEGYQGAQATQSMRCVGIIHARAGQYMEMLFIPNGASGAIDISRLHVQRVG
jgi:hypothetical protein